MKTVIAVGMAVLMAVYLNGCGFKAAPYYEKPAESGGSSVAL